MQDICIHCLVKEAAVQKEAISHLPLACLLVPRSIGFAGDLQVV